MRIFLAPPRNPNSTSAEDRRWHIIVTNGVLAQYTQVYGPASTDAKGAKAEANRILKHKFVWLAKGHGFQARIPKNLQDFPHTDLQPGIVGAYYDPITQQQP